MASTKADNNRVAWKYTSDGAVDYRVSAKAVYVQDGTDGAKYGGTLCSITTPPLPKGFRMRKVKFSSSGHPDIWVPAYTAAATIYTTGATTLVRDVNGVDATFTNGSPPYGRRGEKSMRGGITQQS